MSCVAHGRFPPGCSGLLPWCWLAAAAPHAEADGWGGAVAVRMSNKERPPAPSMAFQPPPPAGAAAVCAPHGVAAACRSGTPKGPPAPTDAGPSKSHGRRCGGGRCGARAGMGPAPGSSRTLRAASRA